MSRRPKQFVVGRTDWLKNIGSRKGSGRSGRSGRSSRSFRMAANARAVPQVVFKVAKNGGAFGAAGLGDQMDYVLGKASHIIDPSGELDGFKNLPTEKAKDLASEWAENWKAKTKSGHTMHMIASFPRGTDPDAVAQIVRSTCDDLLDQGCGRFKYISAVHTDTDHPHAHIIVDRRNADGEYFYLAKDHEFSYDTFKDMIVEHAADHGIELVNTSKLSRGKVDEVVHDRDKKRGMTGTLIDHGIAPYENNPKNSQSYFVTLEIGEKKQTLWSKELAPALRASNAEIGDTVTFTHMGKEPVSFTNKRGEIIHTHKNVWKAIAERRELDENGATEDKLNRQRQIVEAYVEQYRADAERLRHVYPAISKSLSVAADVLQSGGVLDEPTISKLQGERVMPSEEELKGEGAALAASIEDARSTLKMVRERIDELPPEHRPEIEAKYFEAMKDLQTIEGGDVDPAQERQANGSIYDKERGEALEYLDTAELEKSLEGTGIDAREVKARLEVENRTEALEAHWVEKDAQAMAEAKGVDLSTEEGRAEIEEALADTYNTAMERANVAMERTVDAMEADLQNKADLEMSPNDRALRDYQADLAARDNAEREEITFEIEDGNGEVKEVTEAELREMAKADPELKIIEPAEAERIPPTEENIQGLKNYYEEERRNNEIDHDAAGDADRLGQQAEARFNQQDQREFAEEVEDRQANIAEIKRLAEKDTLTADEKIRLVETVDKVLDKDEALELKVGNTRVLSEFGDREKQLDLGEKYLKAEQEFGRERSGSLSNLSKDREIFALEKEHAENEEMKQAQEQASERKRDSGREL